MPSNKGSKGYDIEAAYRIADLDCERVRADAIHNLLTQLTFNSDTVQQINDVFETEMERALTDNGTPSSLQMENTYISELINGSETGLYLALDLGGTQFRVILVELCTGGHVVRDVVEHYRVDEATRLGAGVELFDFLAQSIRHFVHRHTLTECVRLPLGFTFSFPMHQHGLNSAKLVTWTKSFLCTDVVGHDVVAMLQQALHRQNMHNIDVVAILNDTTGTLIQGALLDKRTRIGIILGTGSNACFLERADRVAHWEQTRHAEKNTIIDIEWGAFGDNGVLDFIKTEFDRTVDDASLLRNSFTFEKYIGGKYLGEIMRVIMATMHKKGILFRQTDAGIGIAQLNTPWTFDTNNLSQMASDTLENTNVRTVEILRRFSWQPIDENDVKICQHIAVRLSHRAAHLVAICTAAILRHIGTPAGGDETTRPESIAIAIDGSLYKHHPLLKGWMTRRIRELANGVEFHLMLAEDGSGKGAALAAAIAEKLRNRVHH